MLTQDRIEDLIRKALDLPGSFVLDSEIRPAFVPGWDSIGWLNVITAIEDDANMLIPLEALDDVVSLGDFYAVLSRI